MLTDERIVDLRRTTGPASGYTQWADTIGFSRAIEAEVRKEQTANDELRRTSGTIVEAQQADKIAELTRQLAEALKDAKVYAAILVYGTEAVFPNGTATTEAEMMAAIDSASRALNEASATKAKEKP